jgi:ABC-type polysaccharide/polyol phosphate export permease
MGFIIGHLSKSEEGATMASISVSCLLLLFSGIILPMESLPVGIRDIARINPFVLAEDSLRKLMLFNMKLELIADNIYALLAFIFVFILVMLVLKRRDLRNIFW